MELYITKCISNDNDKHLIERIRSAIIGLMQLYIKPHSYSDGVLFDTNGIKHIVNALTSCDITSSINSLINLFVIQSHQILSFKQMLLYLNVVSSLTKYQNGKVCCEEISKC